jgi:tetratricopeptide (TPR) repeat protein
MKGLLIFLLIPLLEIAQTGDSLFYSITELQNDTEKINRLYSRGFLLRLEDPVLARVYADKAVEVARRAASLRHRAKAANLSGVLYYRKGEYALAIAEHAKALEWRRTSGDLKGRSFSHTNLGNIYLETGQYDRAEKDYLSALTLAAELHDKKNMANCLINLGVLEQTVKSLTPAYENYLSALKIGEELNDYEIRALCLNNIGQVFFEKGDYEKCISFNRDALKLREMMDNDLETADNYLNLAGAYLKLGEPEQARICLDSADSVAGRNGYFDALLLGKKIRADYYHAAGENEKAYTALCVYQRQKDSVEIAATHVAEGKLLTATTAGSDSTKNVFNNRWMLVCLFFFLIFIPLFQFRYLR